MSEIFSSVGTWFAQNWAAALAIIAVAGIGCFIQRVSGFGFGIFAMIFLTRIMDTYWEATALSAVYSIICNTMVLVTMAKYCNWRKMLLPLGPALLLNAVIFFIFEDKPQKLLFIMLGAVLILLSIWFIFFSKKIKVKENVPTALTCGTLSGVMTGLFAMGGPPVVIYFLQTAANNSEYIATIQTFFVFTNAWGLAIKAISGYVTADVLAFSAIGTLGIIAGNWAGGKVYKKLSPDVLRMIVYIFMAVSGVITIVNQLLA